MSELGEQVVPRGPTQTEAADTYEGVVIASPDDPESLCKVKLNHFRDIGDGEKWEFEAKWQPWFTAMPTVGDACVVTFSDDDEAIIVQFTPNNPPPLEAGAGTGDKTYVHDQGSASNTWVIDHGLNKYPSVTVVDSDSPPRVVKGQVEYNTLNRVTVAFNGTFSGKAFLN